jgi:putative hemolysin
MQDLAAQGDRRAAGVLALMQEPRRFIGTVQLAISALASSSAPWASRCCDAASIHRCRRGCRSRWPSRGMTFVSVLIGDLVPKAIAMQRAERLALLLARAIVGLQRLAFPMAWLQLCAAGLLRPLGLRPPGLGTRVHGEQDLRGVRRGRGVRDHRGGGGGDALQGL